MIACNVPAWWYVTGDHVGVWECTTSRAKHDHLIAEVWECTTSKTNTTWSQLPVPWSIGIVQSVKYSHTQTATLKSWFVCETRKPPHSWRCRYWFTFHECTQHTKWHYYAHFLKFLDGDMCDIWRPLVKYVVLIHGNEPRLCKRASVCEREIVWVWVCVCVWVCDIHSREEIITIFPVQKPCQKPFLSYFVLLRGRPRGGVTVILGSTTSKIICW